MIIQLLKQNIALIALFICVVVTGGALMIVSQKVYDKQNSIHQKTKMVAEQEWELRTLKAEWAYLTRPDRIEQLAEASSNSLVAVVTVQEMPVMQASVDSGADYMNTDKFVPNMVQKASYGSTQMIKQAPVPNVKPASLQRKSVQKHTKNTVHSKAENKADFSSLLKTLGHDG